MKVGLRIFVIFFSLGILVTALLPPPDEVVEVKVPVPVPTLEASESQKVIRDLLGGASIDQGKKAAEKISELNDGRKELFDENGL